MNEIESAKETAGESPQETPKTPETPKEPASTQPSTQNILTYQAYSPRRHKILKIILSIATFCQIFSTVIFLLALILQPNIVSLGSLLIIPIIILFGFFLNFIYIIIVFFNSRISKKQKALWVILFSLRFIFPILPPFVSTAFLDIAMSIYWYFYIWKEPIQNQLPEKK